MATEPTHLVEKLLSKFSEGYSTIFITGKAGTGKSTLLKKFVETTQAKIAVTAPTGVAALNIGGETIHSFFRIKPGILTQEMKYEAMNAAKSNRAGIYKNLDYLIIDEISMVRADLLDCIDIFLKTVRNNSSEFGGLKVLLFGDLLQLPPVVKSDEKGPLYQLYENEYFFSSNVIKSLSNSLFPRFTIIELQQVYRQSDGVFLNILNKIRTNEINIEDIELLNSRVKEDEDIDLNKSIALVGKNYKADQINKLHLNLLESNSYFFDCIKTGDFDARLNPAPEKLELKKGARVMFCINDIQNRFVNGQIGIVKEIFETNSDIIANNISTHGVLVEISDTGEIIPIYSHTWEISRLTFNKITKDIERNIIGSFTQLPLLHAWAITIHKAQGKTFDKIHIDLSGGAFAHGQTYVALSRCRTLEGISLTNSIKKSDIIVDIRIADFFKNISIEPIN